MPTIDDTSLSLLERARDGADSESWLRLHRLYVPLLRQWMERYQVQEADAEDLVQEVLAVVARELPQFSHNARTGAFRSWLRNILLHRLRDFWRRRQYRPQATSDSQLERQLHELADDTSHLSQLWARQHDEYIIEHVLRSVQPKVAESTWQAFCLQMYEECTAAEAADRLGMSVDSAYAAKSRVLRMLRQETRGLVD